MTSTDFDALLGQIRQHPEWREELRRLVLTGELLELPVITARLAQQMVQLTERVDALTQRVDALTQRVDALTQRVDALTQRVDALTQRVVQLTEQMDRLTERVDALTQRVDALTERVDALVEQVSEMAGHVEWLKGDAMERRYRERAAAYFGRIARRIHTLSQDELEDLLESALTDQRLTEEQAQQVRLADVVVRGRRPDGEVLLVVEASWGVGLKDVRRAQERAELLQRAGLRAIGVVAGTWITPDVQRVAPQMGVWQVGNGHVTPPEGAVA